MASTDAKNNELYIFMFFLLINSLYVYMSSDNNLRVNHLDLSPSVFSIKIEKSHHFALQLRSCTGLVRTSSAC